MFRFLNQPKGMIVIGCTEIFERLSFYTLVALLALYASAPIPTGGLGWTKEAALMLMGNYTLAAFTLPLLGGFIADRLIGPYRAVIFGALMIITGYGIMYFSNYGLFYLYSALIFVVCGTALFKPSMPVLLGFLYAPNDTRLTRGFNLYYMCINIGGTIAGFSAGLLLQRFGYQVALTSAGVGMFIGLTVFLLGKSCLVIKSKPITFRQDASKSTQKITAVHKKAIFYLLFSFMFFAIWAIGYNIVNSGTLFIYIENFTKKTVFGYNIPTTFFSSLNPIFIVMLAPIVNAVLGYFSNKHKPIHFFSQMNAGLWCAFIAIVYFTYLTKMASHVEMGAQPFNYLNIILFIFIVSLGELLISPVMMAAITILSPPHFRTSFQALNLSMIGIMGLITGKIGAISLSKPYETFYALSVATFVALIIFIALRKQMIHAALNATNELEIPKGIPKNYMKKSTHSHQTCK